MASGELSRHLPRHCTIRRVWIFVAFLITSTVAIAVGTGVGLTRRSDSYNDNPAPIARSTCDPRPKGLLLPAAGDTWNYVLLKPIASPSTIDKTISVWGIDLVDNSADSIKAMQKQGANVICYFSAGSYEDWRPDASNFTSADKGKDMSGWPGEKWIDIRSQNVRNIMKTRMDLAVKKGCNGVDPDNVDGYDNDTGFKLKESDSVDYVTFLANEAHKRGLTVSLKNAGSIISDVVDCVDFSVNEQCHQFKECDTYAPFIDNGKPVFHVEYPKGDDVNNNTPVESKTKDAICKDPTSAGFSTIIKNMNLDEWIQKC